MTAKPNSHSASEDPAAAFQRQWWKAQRAAKALAIATAANPTEAVIHDLRVALRRCRAVTTGFSALLDKAERKMAAEPWRRLSKALGLARALDVAAKAFAKPPPAVDRSALAAMRQRWRRAQQRARGAAAAAAETALADGLFDRAPPPMRQAGDRTLADIAKAALSRQRKRFKTASQGLAKHPAPLRHKARIRAKTWRYVAEMFDDLAPLQHQRRLKRRLADLQVVQDELGALNDLATAPDLATEALAGAPVDQILAAGEALAQAAAPAEERLARARHARRRILRS